VRGLSRRNRSIGGRLAAFALVLLGLSAPVWPESSQTTERSRFPESRPVTRDEAIEFLGAAGADSTAPVTLRVRTLRNAPEWVRGAAWNRALELIGSDVVPAHALRLTDGSEFVVRYSSTPNDLDHVDPTDADGNDRPDVLDATLQGLREARKLLVARLELPAPENLDIVLVDLGDTVDGYVVPHAKGARRLKIVLDGTPPDGPQGARRAAIQQYAYAVAFTMAPEFPWQWAEALANWTVLRLSRGDDGEALDAIARRLERLDQGLSQNRPMLAGGNAAWLSFVAQAYGAVAVRLTIEELAQAQPTSIALDQAIRRCSRDDLATAFREFHLWSVLVGSRSDGLHFPFAGRLPSPTFASSPLALPALSVQSDPPISPLGAAHIRLRPDAADGGLQLYFEGGYGAQWEADPLLFRSGGPPHRVPFELDEDGRGQLTVPAQGVTEALLLLRNLSSIDGGAHSYTYAAHLESGYPFEMTSLSVGEARDEHGGLLIDWETATEQQLVGFNVLRQREAGGPIVTVNPIWVPALGGPNQPTSYRFLDRTADPSVSYVYHIQAITRTGLTARSEPVSAPGSSVERR